MRIYTLEDQDNNLATDNMSDSPPTSVSQSRQREESPPSDDAGSATKKRRGAIATQACDLCRSRKQKCDETRPKCRTCRNANVECVYREAPPTKKDKTMVEILQRVTRLENGLSELPTQNQCYGIFEKVKSLPDGLSELPTQHQFNAILDKMTDLTKKITELLKNVESHSPAAAPPSVSAGAGVSSQAPISPQTDEAHYKYGSSVHEMMGWPLVKKLLEAVQPSVPHLNLSTLDEDGVSAMLAIGRDAHDFVPIEPFGPTSGAVLTKPGRPLGWDHIVGLSNAYFDSFNSGYPILDRRLFMTETLPSVFSQGFGASSATTVALLVFALGEAAHAGFDGRPIHMVEGHASGMRGGGAHLPPGLVWFNEARRRMGFQYTEVKLENVQIFALAGAYYGSCFCPAGFWKSTRAASQACQDLIDSDPKILSGPHATLLRRVFWHCSIMETCLNLELGFPLPNLQRFEEVITQEQDLGTEDGHMLLHFYSQIALRRVLVDFHNKLSQKAGPSVSSLPDRIRECAAELEIWRGLVPVRFAWEERSPVVLPNSIILPRMSTPPSPLINMPSSPGITRQQQPQSMFSIELDDAPERYPNAIDVQIALLRSRYFYTKYLIYRPFIYKALHYPDLMSHTDVVGAIECLRATLKWPVAMSPTCKHKRLIPCMFFFTQSFFGILIIYHLTRTVPALRKIRSLCGDEFEIELNETIGLYLDWVRDLKEIDIGTRFHWDVIKALYGING